MQTTNHGSDLTVAILIDDLQAAKEMTSSLRHQGIFAHLYQTLDEYWVAINIETPDISIIDVTRMSSGPIQFKNHPKVISKQLNYAFFSKESTKILLQSTLGLAPMAYLHQDMTLGLQMGQLIESARREKAHRSEMNDLKERVTRLQARSGRLLTERHKAETFQASFKFIREFLSDLETKTSVGEFQQALSHKFSNWEMIKNFGFYELSQNGQKLIAPEMHKKNFVPFPSLWLGQTNTQGIEFFAQDMAFQVANDLFETEPKVIKLHGSDINPESLIFIETVKNEEEFFPWEVFELMLTQIYRQVRLQENRPVMTTQAIPMWEAMELMDRWQAQAGEESGKIIFISMTSLLQTIKRRQNNRFYWSAFYHEFFSSLTQKLDQSSRLSVLGPGQIVVFVEKEKLEAEHIRIQTVLRQFSYWRFFEDDAQVLGSEIYPQIKLLPASAQYCLRVMEKDWNEASETEFAINPIKRERSRGLTL
jgi:hypothetical protein